MFRHVLYLVLIVGCTDHGLEDMALERADVPSQALPSDIGSSSALDLGGNSDSVATDVERNGGLPADADVALEDIVALADADSDVARPEVWADGTSVAFDTEVGVDDSGSVAFDTAAVSPDSVTLVDVLTVDDVDVIGDVSNGDVGLEDTATDATTEMDDSVGALDTVDALDAVDVELDVQCAEADGNPCILSWVPGADGCAPVFAETGTLCDDQKLETKDDSCDGLGTCTGSLIDCSNVPINACVLGYAPDGNACAPNFAQSGTECDDGLSNTVGDVCDGAGGCLGEPCDAALTGGRLVHGLAPPLAKLDPACGLVSYGTYAAEGELDAIHLIPDYSYAGYMGGGVAIPEIPTTVVVEPSPGDDLVNIQAAIDSVSALPLSPQGFRGAVELSAGTFTLSDSIYIQESGVVLRGAGQGADGTVLVATKPEQHSLIRVQGTGSGFGTDESTATAVASPIVPVGALEVAVVSAAEFAVGDSIVLRRTPNQEWLDTLGMAQWGWTTSSYAISHEREIVAIDGDVLTLNVPVVDAIDANYGGGEVVRAEPIGRITQVGVEDLRLVSEYASASDEAHGWNGVRLSRVTNSWVRRVTAVHFGYAAVTIHNQSNYNSVIEVAQLDPISQVTGGRRYSFNVSGGVGNLFMRCFARDGRHNFVTGSRVTGPHVWLDSLSVQNNSDEGPHHRWATGLLFDSCKSKIFNVQNRKSSGSGHGWAGAQTVFWNIIATSEVRCDAPTGAMNFAVGAKGTKKEGAWAPEEPFGYFESHGSPVVPRSLYLAQLKSRLGDEAVAAVTIPEQLEGPIYTLLSYWAGNGALSDVELPELGECQGIQSGSVCCALSCGACGGQGCGALPGGSENCCGSQILAANQSCAFTEPPCVLPNPDGQCDGIQSGDACCKESCGACGGSGCSQLPGGAEACCTGAIIAAGNSCAQHLPPCVVE